MPQLKDVVLVTIARNESRCIGRLLRSVRPWVDSMVVLDTGSEDDTIKIAREMGATVERFTWTDDFSTARNAALDLAGARWHLVLDADEWIVGGGDFLQRLSLQPPEWVGQIRLDEVAGPEAESGCVSRNWLTRLLPGHVRFSGRIHEQPAHDLPHRRTPLVVAHDGYSASGLIAKRGRNRRLLMAELQDRADDPYLHYQMGKDASVYEEHGLAHTHFCTAWKQADARASWRLDLVVRWLSTMKELNLHESAAEVAAHELTRYDLSPDFHFAVGDLMLDWTATAPQSAERLLMFAEQAWRRCLQIGERPDLPGSVPGRGSHLAAFNLALVLEATGRGEEAMSLRQVHRLGEVALLT